ncbi:MAG: glycosyltransferase [Gemmatimonadetes bacterium]|nr:glycosyltransferase [Gemmatimonadota bacterium]NNF37060.1 glycosyltransferase [Gemmatimonadota bacterium]NNK62715.1 glycosyltransferase [Gemmatimonadota bacterium]
MTVTCVIPVYNGARYLGEALDSVLDQGVDGLEVVVVDDGSTDDTPSVLDGYGDRLRVIRQDNAGPAAARNRGVEAAGGAFVCFQDADDLWAPGRLQRQLAVFEELPDTDLCLGLVQNFWMPELEAEARTYAGTPFAHPAPGFIFPALVARREVFEQVGAIDPTLRVGEDNDWFLRAREAGLVEHVVPEVILRRRLHENNLTRRDLASREALLRNMKASLDRRRAGGSS